MQDLGRAVDRVRAGGKCPRLSILHRLKYAPHIVIESFGKSRGILVWEEGSEIRWLRRIATKQFDIWLVLKDTRDLIAREKHWDLPRGGREPLHQLPLGMGV